MVGVTLVVIHTFFGVILMSPVVVLVGGCVGNVVGMALQIVITMSWDRVRMTQDLVGSTSRTVAYHRKL